MTPVPFVPARFLWIGAAAMGLGALLVSGGWEQRTPELRVPLGSAVPVEIAGFRGSDQEISAEEKEVAGFTDYLMRQYEPAEVAEGDDRWMSVYVGYYDTQTKGRTIHSPKNCLPGSGWEALNATRVGIPVASGEIEVNRYLLQNGEERALVLYWYQGRGRVVASEYRAKWELLRDAALSRRSDEALVRIVVPLVEGVDEEEAFRLARAFALELEPAIHAALPI